MCNAIRLNNITMAIANHARQTFGNMLDKVLLYGSYARGTFDNESDIDILIEVRLEKHLLAEYRKDMSCFASRLSLEHDILISIHLQDSDTFERYKDAVPFYMNIIQEGVILVA